MGSGYVPTDKSAGCISREKDGGGRDQPQKATTKDKDCKEEMRPSRRKE